LKRYKYVQVDALRTGQHTKKPKQLKRLASAFQRKRTMAAAFSVKIMIKKANEKDKDALKDNVEFYIKEKKLYIAPGFVVSDSVGFHKGDNHATVVIRDKGVSFLYFDTVTGLVVDKLHVLGDEKKRSHEFAMAIITDADYKRCFNSKDGVTIPGQTVKTYWIAANGHPREMEFFTGRKIDVAAQKAIATDGLRNVPKDVYDKVVAGGAPEPTGKFTLTPQIV